MKFLPYWYLPLIFLLFRGSAKYKGYCLLLRKEIKGMQPGFEAFKAMFYLIRFHSYSMRVKSLTLEAR